jgi:FecR protein
MRVSRRKTTLLLLFLLTFFSLTFVARAEDDDDEPDDYDVKARVVRISMMDGEVNLKRNGNQDWETARLNYPLVEGDTVNTGNDGRLEIQIDSRNFVRLAANSVLRIVTLRDEGIAISAIEGTVIVRLTKFERKKGYFEIDAPKTTMTAEKEGLYRIDAPRNGRVRLTVREGGNARIYSDTSGFTLRDGRSAELVVNGETAGDWEFAAAATRDSIDDWVSERERFLATRLKHDVKYYDEDVWGGEDLDAYGDWSKNDEYGWVWRPHPASLSTFSDWAPYRYGNWTWLKPYGWTWVGYEPWGWAPYHYGRWVYHNGYWVWVPRSQFYKKRSWWRPALVAFVFDSNFGNDYCWYPLGYYQRDPHSRNYRHDRDGRYGRNGRRDRDGRHDRPGYGEGGDRGGRRYPDGHPGWRGVSRMPRRDVGDPNRPGVPAGEVAGRRIIEADPERGDFPLRGGQAGANPNQPRRDDGDSGNRRRPPVVRVSERPTGATQRAPGVALDDDLRRSRVFRGREPRPDNPVRPVVQTGAATPAPTSETENRPSGAVARPEPGSRRGERREEGERRRRDRDSGDNTPRNAEPRNAAPPSTPETNNNQPAPVARPETPRESRPQPRPESRPVEQPRPRFEPRTSPDDPRPQRIPEPRSEPRSERRSESPRSEPRSEPRSQPSRPDPPPRNDPPRSESPRSESRPAPEGPRGKPNRP